MITLKFKPSTIPVAHFYFYSSYENDYVASTTETHLRIILYVLLSSGFIASLLKTMQDHIYGCTNQHHCTYAIYLLSFIDLKCCISIDRSVGENFHRKDSADGLNYRYKQMINLWMENILSHELIDYDTSFYKLMQVHKT